MKIKKRHYSLSVKLNALVIAIILALSGGLTAIAYRVNSVRVDQYFKAATASAAGTVAARPELSPLLWTATGSGTFWI